jgi:hypothetical protein
MRTPQFLSETMNAISIMRASSGEERPKQCSFIAKAGLKFA